MEWAVVERRELLYSRLEVRAGYLGSDVLVCVEGGSRPHIGCAVLAVPRPSLSGDGTISVTSSVMNLTGHKDEALCRRLAERICREVNAVTVCTGGFHLDGMGKEQIEMVVKAMEEAADVVQKKLGRKS